MTNKEAIDILTKEIKCLNFDEDLCVIGTACDGCEYNVGYIELTDALEIAVKAMEKQIPQKAVGEHYAHMRCPSCNHRIPSGGGSSSRRRDNWCNYCGQAIDWMEG